MIKKEFEMFDSMGLHARPASMLTKKASSFGADIKIEYKTKEINAKSIMGVMALGVCKGDIFSIIVDGEDEDMIIEALTDTLKENKLISES